MPESTISPQSGTKNVASGLFLVVKAVALKIQPPLLGVFWRSQADISVIFYKTEAPMLLEEKVVFEYNATGSK
jgi:hypothetical protein